MLWYSTPLHCLSLATHFLIFLASAQTVIHQTASTPTVHVLNGSYTGIHNPIYNQDFFLGIPYAQPPIGDLRFRQAQSLNTSWKASKEATAYSPECIGYGGDDTVLGNPVAEDCLTLNVVRPSAIEAKLPVAVWIHGGIYVMGGSRDPRYNLSFIVQQSTYSKAPFIGVSINYRLQAWGFLFGKEILDAGVANIGFRDQRLALHWIQENIAAFGGDPTKVTIWGESAGAGSVGMQLVAYGGRDDKLFRGAIAESGAPTPFYRYETTESYQKSYDDITQAVNCKNTTDSLACLRTVPVDLLSGVFNSSITAQATFGPQIDGDFLTESASSQLNAGKFVRVPLLIGANNDEGTAFDLLGINTTAQFLAFAASLGPDNATANTLAALYPDIPAIGIPKTLVGRPPPADAFLGVQYKRSASYTGDFAMHAPRRLASQAWAAHNVSSWSYVFDVLVNGVSEVIGSTHFQEVAFVMHNVDGEGYAINPFGGKGENFTQLATLMARMWGSFIVDLDPNKSGVTDLRWPEYSLSDPRNLVFDTSVEGVSYVEPDLYRAEGIAFMMEHMIDVYGR